MHGKEITLPCTTLLSPFRPLITVTFSTPGDEAWSRGWRLSPPAPSSAELDRFLLKTRKFLGSFRKLELGSFLHRAKPLTGGGTACSFRRSCRCSSRNIAQLSWRSVAAPARRILSRTSVLGTATLLSRNLCTKQRPYWLCSCRK